MTDPSQVLDRSQLLGRVLGRDGLCPGRLWRAHGRGAMLVGLGRDLHRHVQQLPVLRGRRELLPVLPKGQVKRRKTPYPVPSLLDNLAFLVQYCHTIITVPIATELVYCCRLLCGMAVTVASSNADKRSSSVGAQATMKTTRPLGIEHNIRKHPKACPMHG